VKITFFLNLKADPKKSILELVDSLITHGEYRKTLAMLDSFQRRKKEEIYLIQSEYFGNRLSIACMGE